MKVLTGEKNKKPLVQCPINLFPNILHKKNKRKSVDEKKHFVPILCRGQFFSNIHDKNKLTNNKSCRLKVMLEWANKWSSPKSNMVFLLCFLTLRINLK